MLSDWRGVGGSSMMTRAMRPQGRSGQETTRLAMGMRSPRGWEPGTLVGTFQR